MVSRVLAQEPVHYLFVNQSLFSELLAMVLIVGIRILGYLSYVCVIINMFEVFV